MALKPQNIVGPEIRRLRRLKKMKQADLAARCGVLGWDVAENVITKIEGGYRCITDIELVVMAKALGITVKELFSRIK
jgi:transcriptional regulator with XRE-family HTH domain